MPRRISKKYLLVVGFIVVAILTGFAMKVTSEPGFCVSCHEMKPMYTSWSQSSHQDVDCMACHAKPGVVGYVHTKVGALREVYSHFTGIPEKIVAHVPAERCIAAGCHQPDLLPDDKFPHRMHLNFNLDCMHCHNRIPHGGDKPYPRDITREVCRQCHQ